VRRHSLNPLTPLFVLGLVGTVGCAPARPGDYQPAAIRESILATLPAGWKAAEPTDEDRRCLAMYLNGPDIGAFVLVGPKRSSAWFSDKDDRPHEERDMYQECIYLWIAPPDTPPGLTLNPKVLPGPRCLYASRTGKVYGMESERCIDPARFTRILAVDGTGTIGAAGEPPSWRGWRRDIRAGIGRDL